MADRAEVQRILDEIARRLLDERIEEEARQLRESRQSTPIDKPERVQEEKKRH
jgi:hypothetical protein